MVYKIRERSRRGYSREAQGYAVWTEWQVVDGRRVVARFDFEAQAARWVERQATDAKA